MKRLTKILAPPAVFALAALLAWLSGSPPDPLAASEIGKISKRIPQHAETENSDQASTVIREFERLFLLDSASTEIIDQESMETSIDNDLQSAGMPGGGMSSIYSATEWAASDPGEMFSWLMQRGPTPQPWGGDQRQFLTYLLFDDWASQDPEAAVAAVATISNRQIRKQALLSSLEAMVKNHPLRVRELLMENLALFGPDNSHLYSQSHNSGVNLCETLLTLPPDQGRNNLLATIMNDMAGWYEERVAGQALALWQKAPNTLRRELVAAGFTSDPEKSGSYEGLEELMQLNAETAGDPAAAGDFIRIKGPAWAKRNLPEALAWTQEYLRGEDRVDTSAELFEYAASEDFDEALRIWQTLPGSIMKARAAGYISSGAPPERRPEAEALVESLPPQDRRQAWKTR